MIFIKADEIMHFISITHDEKKGHVPEDRKKYIFLIQGIVFKARLYYSLNIKKAILWMTF
jgi:hypothetical protein